MNTSIAILVAFSVIHLVSWTLVLVAKMVNSVSYTGGSVTYTICQD